MVALTLPCGGVHEREKFESKMAVLPLILETGLGAIYQKQCYSNIIYTTWNSKIIYPYRQMLHDKHSQIALMADPCMQIL